MEQSNLGAFSPAKIEEKRIEKEEDVKIMEHLSKKTAKELMEGLKSNGGHPIPEWKDSEEDTWRFYYMDECQRRGLKLFEELGWPSDKDSLYVNLYTGGVETLLEVATSTHSPDKPEECIAEHNWSVIEHWVPYDPIKPNEYLIKYLEDEIRRLQSLKDGPPVSYENKTAKHRAQLSKNLLECRIKLDKELTKRGKNGNEKCD